MGFSYENQTNLGKPVEFLKKITKLNNWSLRGIVFLEKSRKNQEPIKNDKLLWTTDAM